MSPLKRRKRILPFKIFDCASFFLMAVLLKIIVDGGMVEVRFPAFCESGKQKKNQESLGKIL